MNGDVDDDIDDDNSEDEYFENEEQQAKPSVNGVAPEAEKITPSSNLNEVGIKEDTEGQLLDDGSKLSVSLKTEELPLKSVSDFSESDVDAGGKHNVFLFLLLVLGLSCYLYFLVIMTFPLMM